MDKNQAFGFLLMATLLVVYFYFFAPTPQPVQDTPEQTTTAQQAPARRADTPMVREAQETNGDSLQLTVLQEKFGLFSNAVQGESETITVENEAMIIEFSTQGGLIRQVTLKNYENYQYEPLVLLDRESSQMRYLINTPTGEINISDLYFDAGEGPVTANDTTTVSFRLQLDGRRSVVYEYRIPNENYVVLLNMSFEDMNDLVPDSKVTLAWHNDLKRLETDMEYSRDYTTVNYFFANGSFDELSPRSSDKEEEAFTEPVDWFAFSQKFFTTGMVFNRPVQNGYVSSMVNESDTTVIKNCEAIFQIPLEQLQPAAAPFKLYFGPNRLQELGVVSDSFKENLYLGWPVISWINKYLIINLFHFLERFTSNYGIIIIILVFIIKLVLSPLTYKSHMSMAKTKALKPELDELKEKYGDDMQKMQSEQMKLYQQVGVNPLSGCLPMLLQMPFLFAMFQFIPHAIELRHEPFLWAEDLSHYDSIMTLPFTIPGYGDHVSLFTLLMTLSTLLYTWANSQATATMQGPMKTMQYIMPLIFLFMLNSFPAGLTFYYFVSNLVSFAQIAIIRRFVDDSKIRAILEENKEKNKGKKKSKFQQRLEDAMKAKEATTKKPARR
jgi:YidC/Oxa1 family membrane protein insertase